MWLRVAWPPPCSAAQRETGRRRGLAESEDRPVANRAVRTMIALTGASLVAATAPAAQCSAWRARAPPGGRSSIRGAGSETRARGVLSSAACRAVLGPCPVAMQESGSSCVRRSAPRVSWSIEHWWRPPCSLCRATSWSSTAMRALRASRRTRMVASFVRSPVVCRHGGARPASHSRASGRGRPCAGAASAKPAERPPGGVGPPRQRGGHSRSSTTFQTSYLAEDRAWDPLIKSRSRKRTRKQPKVPTADLASTECREFVRVWHRRWHRSPSESIAGNARTESLGEHKALDHELCPRHGFDSQGELAVRRVGSGCASRSSPCPGSSTGLRNSRSPSLGIRALTLTSWPEPDAPRSRRTHQPGLPPSIDSPTPPR
jgi:hypothetical protein